MLSDNNYVKCINSSNVHTVVANDQYTLIEQLSHIYNSIDTIHKHTVIKQSLKVYAICNDLLMQTCI